jgi:hypothetical protein
MTSFYHLFDAQQPRSFPPKKPTRIDRAEVIDRFDNRDGFLTFHQKIDARYNCRTRKKAQA